ncbi:MAG: aminotransferase class III-fold pyridoxal phosphate-dependent enzyme [Prolixibacteraceae bacterium]
MRPFNVFQKFPVNIVSGKSCYVYDDKGNEYLDLYCGHAVILVGHTHPYYVSSILDQLDKIGFYSNAVGNALQMELAEKLGISCGYEDYRVFFSNSGAEANENALKLASYHNKRRKVLAFSGAFHGRTAAAAMATDFGEDRAPINESLSFSFVPFNDMGAVEERLYTGEYSAVIVEGIQGVAGVNVADNTFLNKLTDLCKTTNTILILDEIQCGYGRSGRFFVHQYAGIKPDLITVAKGMGNGFPIAATLIHPKFEEKLGRLGSTFGGNHLGCAAALSVLKIIEAESLIENAERIGTYLLETLCKFRQIKSVRGRGLMIGLEFESPIVSVRHKLLYKERIFTGASGDHIIRLLPPLCLTIQQADIFLAALEKCLRYE